MKRNIYQLVVLAALAAVTVFIVGCVQKKGTQSCSCTDFPVVEKTYDGKSITVYNAFTPSPEPYCDSIVIPEPAGLCRPVPDKDTGYIDAKNEYFYIKGIEAFFNHLMITVPGDTSKVFQSYDYSNNLNYIFNGTIMQETLWGNSRRRPLDAKVFEYQLVLYKDKEHRLVIDTVKGKFRIIRNKTDCVTSGCVGHDVPDQLLN